MSSELLAANRAAPVAKREVAIRVQNLCKRYQIYDRPEHRLWQGLFRGRKQFVREFWALTDVSFDVFRGETVGIIGHNGSGKSTLLQIICGTLAPTSGSVAVTGRIGALLELGAGFSPEFTGRENVYMSAAVLGLSNDEINAKYEDIVTFADIGEFIDQPLKTYSSGMFVRLAFGVIANIDADVLVIDEALAVGDAAFTQKCMRYLRSFQERGTILFVSHDASAIMNLCDRAIWLNGGRAIHAGSAKEIVEAYLQSIIETAQGDSSAPPAERATDASPTPGASSPSSHENEMGQLELAGHSERGLFVLDSKGPCFGKGGAAIVSAYLTDKAQAARGALRGGDACTLRVLIRANEEINGVIVGFHLKDRLGQIVFGENTFLSTRLDPLTLPQGESAWATFVFRLPFLRAGTYSFDLAVAEGTQELHVQHQWFFDAIIVQVLSAHPVSGILAIPMQDVSLLQCNVASAEASTDEGPRAQRPNTSLFS